MCSMLAGYPANKRQREMAPGMEVMAGKTMVVKTVWPLENKKEHGTFCRSPMLDEPGEPEAKFEPREGFVGNGFLCSWIATSSANLGLVGASGYVSQLKFASKSSSILRQFDRWSPIAMAFHIARRCNAEMKAQRSIQDADLAYLGEENMQGLHWGCVQQS